MPTLIEGRLRRLKTSLRVTRDDWIYTSPLLLYLSAHLALHLPTSCKTK